MAAQSMAQDTPESASAFTGLGQVRAGGYEPGGEWSLHLRTLRQGLGIGFTKTNRHKKVPPSNESTPQKDIIEEN